MDLSAIVLSFNSVRYIETCVRSLVQSFSACALQGEIFVIENGSIDGSVECLRRLEAEFAGQLKVFYLPQNTGTTRSRNLGLREARGAHVLILDSDAYMNPEALQALVNYQRHQPRAGMVAPRLIYPDGRFQLSVDVFPTVGRKFERFFSLKALERQAPPAEAGAESSGTSAPKIPTQPWTP